MRTNDHDTEQLDHDSPPRVWLCGNPESHHLLLFTCPMRWDDLQEADVPKVRFCFECQRNVHLCESPEQFVDLSERGECVALLPQIFNGARRNCLMTPDAMHEVKSMVAVGMPKRITRAEIDRLRQLSALSAFGISVPELPVLGKTTNGEKK
ncbi:MAG: hypothetical protein RL651_1963 [Pseudomonadota bacterium]|jgi:hypothetical protein